MEVEEEGETEAGAEAAEAAEAAKAGGAPPVSFISHERERKELGKPCWSHIASEIPRVQHDGSLAMPGTGRRDDVDLSTLRRRFPSLPFVKFEGAARATVLYEEVPEVTEGVMAQVRACFAAEAAGITIALCMPELWAREELMQEERYCVKVGGKPVGCKLPCPGCEPIPLRILDRLARSDALTHPVRPTAGRAQRTADQVRREVLAQWPAGKATITLPAAEREPDGAEA
mmetsp:Transcript_33448/g.110604  ORF Transcript_33448/g.110604 Transcript_33448/m.110604 type:complete len:230 (-) Transcript_33448:258-947(-)